MLDFDAAQMHPPIILFCSDSQERRMLCQPDWRKCSLTVNLMSKLEVLIFSDSTACAETTKYDKPRELNFFKMC